MIKLKDIINIFVTKCKRCGYTIYDLEPGIKLIWTCGNLNCDCEKTIKYVVKYVKLSTVDNLLNDVEDAYLKVVRQIKKMQE